MSAGGEPAAWSSSARYCRPASNSPSPRPDTLDIDHDQYYPFIIRSSAQTNSKIFIFIFSASKGEVKKIAQGGNYGQNINFTQLCYLIRLRWFRSKIFRHPNVFLKSGAAAPVDKLTRATSGELPLQGAAAAEVRLSEDVRLRHGLRCTEHLLLHLAGAHRPPPRGQASCGGGCGRLFWRGGLFGSGDLAKISVGRGIESENTGDFMPEIYSVWKMSLSKPFERI